MDVGVGVIAVLAARYPAVLPAQGEEEKHDRV